MGKKPLFTIAFITGLLFSAVVGTQQVSMGRANPYRYAGDVPPKPSTAPPKILIFSPKNNTAYSTNNITIEFNVTAPTGPTVSSPIASAIYYDADWLESNITVYKYTSDHYSGKATNGRYTEFSSEIWRSLRPKTCNLNLTRIPEGNHSLTIVAWYSGWYVPGIEAMTSNGFAISGSSSVFFAVDTTPPSISVISVENKTYSVADIPLDFTLSEQVSQITYSLDGQKNVTISGNTTLTSLPYGEHSVTVYAADNAGNVGASETIYFNIEEPVPTTMVIAPIAVVSVIASGLIIYFKKRRVKSGG